MTTATGAEEVPFTSGMREPPKEEGWQDVTVKATGRNLWTLHSMTHRVLDALGIVQSKAQSMADRGPADYAESDFERGMRAGAKLTPRYTNGDERGSDSGNGEKALLKWILGVLGLLLVGGVGGGVAMYGQLAAIQKGQEGHEQRIDRLERERDQRTQNGAP